MVLDRLEELGFQIAESSAIGNGYTNVYSWTLHRNFLQKIEAKEGEKEGDGEKEGEKDDDEEKDGKNAKEKIGGKNVEKTDQKRAKGNNFSFLNGFCANLSLRK